MANAAIVILADTETHADMGRVANGLEVAKEFSRLGPPAPRRGCGRLPFPEAVGEYAGSQGDRATRGDPP